ncbi:hypothetical protein B0H34DRAFT_711457 [Crassisporium funariophilum]|nr:hypothetical protein B0H34DRAFT_711457 [Crassisporium funariophilum]
MDEKNVMDLLNLPFDMLLAVLAFTAPSDILALRKTCRTMMQVTSLRSVWIDVLERVCYENSVLRASFPRTDMSLLELEAAAMGPTRCLTAFKKAHEEMRTSLPPLGPRHALHPPGFVPTYCNRIFLIPGGRYLLTLYLGYLEIRDLRKNGLRPHLSQQITPLARSFTVHNTSNGQCVRICVKKHQPQSKLIPYAPPNPQYEIYEIGFVDDIPAIVKLSSLIFPRSFLGYKTYICDDRLIAVGVSSIGAWNFISDECAHWTTNSSEESLLNIVHENTVMVFQKSGISIWNIPSLLPSLQPGVMDPVSSTPLRPQHFLPYPEPTPQGEDGAVDFECRSTSTWYTGYMDRLWFDKVIKGQDSTRLFIKRYQIWLTHEESDPYRLVKAFEFTLDDQGATRHLPYRVCGENTCMSWLTRTTIECNLGPSTIRRANQSNYTMALCSATDVGRRQAGFCPFTGRLCHVSYDTNDIQIIDFLAPPTQPEPPVAGR